MKVVIFKGGLGNQLFQYNLYTKLKEAGHHMSAINGCQTSHNGFEVTKFFDADIKFCPPILIFLFFKFCGLPQKIRNFFIIDEKNFHEDGFLLYFNDYWQNKQYFPSKCCLHFKQIPLNESNNHTLKMIKSSNSISIHVRRGDYLEGGNSDIFVNLSETDYYQKAIREICLHVENPTFFIFSNDIEWCRDHLKLANAHYIDWNKGKDSIFDMYLMSHCRYNIIANSTFSYWAAFLNQQTEKVFYPMAWYKGESPNIFPKEWIGI